MNAYTVRSTIRSITFIPTAEFDIAAFAEPEICNNNFYLANRLPGIITQPIPFAER